MEIYSSNARNLSYGYSRCWKLWYSPRSDYLFNICRIFYQTEIPSVSLCKFWVSGSRFVAEVGFLATGWVGVFSGWFQARIVVPAMPFCIAPKKCLIGFGMIFSFAILATSIGYYLGIIHTHDYSNWAELGFDHSITDLPPSVRVAYIHSSSYIGVSWD